MLCCCDRLNAFLKTGIRMSLLAATKPQKKNTVTSTANWDQRVWWVVMGPAVGRGVREQMAAAGIPPTAAGAAWTAACHAPLLASRRRTPVHGSLYRARDNVVKFYCIRGHAAGQRVEFAGF